MNKQQTIDALRKLADELQGIDGEIDHIDVHVTSYNHRNSKESTLRFCELADGCQVHADTNEGHHWLWFEREGIKFTAHYKPGWFGEVTRTREVVRETCSVDPIEYIRTHKERGSTDAAGTPVQDVEA